MTIELPTDVRERRCVQRLVSIGNGKSPLRCLMATFAELNKDRGLTADDACLGAKLRGLKWERRHITTALNNMAQDGQLNARWDGHQRRFFPINANDCDQRQPPTKTL